MQKTGGLSLITNGHLNNQNPMNKDLIDIPNHKIFNNHVRVHTQIPIEPNDTFKAVKHIDTSKEKEMVTKEFKDSKEINISDHMCHKNELILNSNDISGKEQAKLNDLNSKQLAIKTRRKVDTTNNTSVFPVK